MAAKKTTAGVNESISLNCTENNIFFLTSDYNQESLTVNIHGRFLNIKMDRNNRGQVKIVPWKNMQIEDKEEVEKC